MVTWEIKDITLTFEFTKRRKNSYTAGYNFINFYDLSVYSTGGKKIKINIFQVSGLNIHAIKYKHNIIESICKSNSMAMLNLKNNKNKQIANLAKLKIELFPKNKITTKKVEKVNIPHYTMPL